MSWVWAPVMFILGAIVGVVITALIAYDSFNVKEDRKRWWEDE